MSTTAKHFLDITFSGNTIPDMGVNQSAVDSGMTAFITIDGKRKGYKVYSNIFDGSCTFFIKLKGKRHYLDNYFNHYPTNINMLINIDKWFIEIKN